MIPLGQHWVPLIIAFYDQQGLLRPYLSGAPTPVPSQGDKNVTLLLVQTIDFFESGVFESGVFESGFLLKKHGFVSHETRDLNHLRLNTLYGRSITPPPSL